LHGTRLRLLWPFLAASLFLSLAAATFVSAADARKSLKKSIWGPVRLDGVSQFPIYRDLGAGLYQITLSWQQTAPTRPQRPRKARDPAYDWPADLDYAVREARRHGIRVAIQVTRCPSWANGGRDGRWAPRRRRDFANFVYAASRRYRKVRHWMIWGEPTRHEVFMPLFHEVRNQPLTRRMKRGPRKYARILDAAYGALKRRNPRNLVIGGNSFTTGDVSPRNWIPNLRLRDGRPPRMDLYGHNPFTARKPDLSQPPLGEGFADFSDLDTLSRWVDRWLARPLGKRRLRLFLSEMFWPTDHFNHEFNYYVTRETQADWLTRALRITRRWSRIYTFGWYSLYDDPPEPEGDEVNRGLITYSGQKKPSYRAYKRG
jgi:hypothetical protein